jgi:hypothetical protein
MTENGATQPRATATWRMTLAAALAIFGSTTASVSAEPGPNPLEPVDTSSPRATFFAFRDSIENAYRSWLLREGAEADAQGRRALRTLDLRHVGEALLHEIGMADALYLYETAKSDRSAAA